MTNTTMTEQALTIARAFKPVDGYTVHVSGRTVTIEGVRWLSCTDEAKRLRALIRAAVPGVLMTRKVQGTRLMCSRYSESTRGFRAHFQVAEPG